MSLQENPNITLERGDKMKTLPYYDSGVFYLENSLLDEKEYENYGGEIVINEGSPTVESFQSYCFDPPQELIDRNIVFEDLKIDKDNSYIIKYKKGVWDTVQNPDSGPSGDPEKDVDLEYAIEVTGEEKEKVLNHFLDKYSDELQEFYAHSYGDKNA